MKTISEIAEMYSVSRVSVRNWTKDGLPFQTEKIIGRKKRIVIDPLEVEKYHKNKGI